MYFFNFISLKKPSYGSKIFITSDTLPISYHNKVKDDFKKTFSIPKNFFESWKSQNNINLSYSDLFKYESQNNLVRGLESLESDTSVFIIGKRGPSYIFVKLMSINLSAIILTMLNILITL